MVRNIFFQYHKSSQCLFDHFLVFFLVKIVVQAVTNQFNKLASHHQGLCMYFSYCGCCSDGYFYPTTLVKWNAHWHICNVIFIFRLIQNSPVNKTNTIAKRHALDNSNFKHHVVLCGLSTKQQNAILNFEFWRGEFNQELFSFLDDSRRTKSYKDNEKDWKKDRGRRRLKTGFCIFF